MNGMHGSLKRRKINLDVAPAKVAFIPRFSLASPIGKRCKCLKKQAGDTYTGEREQKHILTYARARVVKDFLAPGRSLCIFTPVLPLTLKRKYKWLKI